MDGEHLRTPSRTTFARRLCSTPIRASEAADDEVAGGDVSSFLSTLDEFVEQCDSFLPAHPQASFEDDAADICAEGLEFATGNVRNSSVCFTGCDEGQSLPKHECTTRRSSYAHDDKIGPQDDDEVIALSSEDECIESIESDQYTPVSQQSGSSSAMACKVSVEDADETLTLSSEDECTEAIQSGQYASDPQRSGCSSVKVQCRKPDFVDILEDSHCYQNTEHVQGSEGNNDCMTPEHDTSYVILEELNCENSLSPSRNDSFHPNSREQEHMLVSKGSTARTKENQCKHQEQSFHGNYKNAMLYSYGVHRQELEPGELSHGNVTHTEGASETRRCSEASCRNEGNHHYKFNSSCQMQNACTSRCAYFSEKPEEQQCEQYTQGFNKSCAMEDASTFKDYKDEPLEPESFDDFNKSCVMEDASTFKDYKDEPLESESFDDSCIMEDASALKEYGEAEWVDAEHVNERYNESCVMEDASAFIRHGKATEKELACPDSPCSTHERKESRLPAEHLMTVHDRGSNEYVVQCSTNCAPQKVFASDQKQVCGFKTEWSNVYAQNSSLQSSAVGVCNKSYTGKEHTSCIMPCQQQVNQVSKALEDCTSESSRIVSPSEAATRESDITAAKPSADQKNEHRSSGQEPAASCESASSNLILKQHLEVNASANSPAYFTDVVQSVPDICARSSFCHEDTVERIPGLEEPNRPIGLSARGDDHAYSSSSQEQELKDNSVMSGAETGGKIEVPAPVRLKDNDNEVDIVPAVDKECKGTSQEVCSSSKAAFHSDEHLDPNDICDTADIFETTLVAEVDLNIASSAYRCTSTGISRPSLSSTVASGGTLDLGVETEDTLIAEAQSPLASAKSTEHCLPMQLPTDVPKSGSVTSGDTLDLGVESDDMFVAEVESPVASEKSANCCQPTSQTANASTHDVLGQQCADMLGCMLPQDFSVPSADTKSLAVDSPAHPLLASTSSEDELHIPEDLDMREKLKLIRAQQERHFRSLHEPEDQHAHVNNTVPSDIKGLEPHLPIAKAPEVKNKAPFMSEDPDENMDNENPEWEAVRSLTTDEERYRAVQEVWHNIRIPDPHKELSTFNYRRHTLSMKHAKSPRSSKPKRRKRKASHNSQHEHTKPVKRQRFDTDIIDLKLKELKRKREKDVTKAQKTFRDDIRELHMTLMRTSQEMHASHDHGHSSKHHRRAHTTPWDFRYYLSQEQRICDEFKANEKSIQSNYMAKEHKLLSARNEVRCVDDFYAGLRDKDPRLLSDKQVREHLKREEMLGYFKVVYKTPKE